MAKPIHVSQPARGIVDLLGGGRTVAKALGIAPSTVTRWSSEKDGKGRIPSRHWVNLMILAQDQGHELSIYDFIPDGVKNAT